MNQQVPTTAGFIEIILDEVAMNALLDTLPALPSGERKTRFSFATHFIKSLPLDFDVKSLSKRLTDASKGECVQTLGALILPPYRINGEEDPKTPKLIQAQVAFAPNGFDFEGVIGHIAIEEYGIDKSLVKKQAPDIVARNEAIYPTYRMDVIHSYKLDPKKDRLLELWCDELEAITSMDNWVERKVHPKADLFKIKEVRVGLYPVQGN